MNAEVPGLEPPDHPAVLEHKLLVELALLTALDRPASLARLARRADWEVVVELARRQRLLGQLAIAIDDGELRHLVPEPSLAWLDRERRLRRRWFHRRALPQLSEACAALTGAGITPVLLKGAALVCSGVVPPDGRPMADLDLWVELNRVDAASEVLTGLGYVRRASASNRSWARRNHYQDPAWYHPEHPLALEIHWDLLTRRSRLAFDTSTLGRKPLSLPNGTSVEILDAPAQLTHLALHFWRDRRSGGGAPIGQLWDIHRASQALSAQEWHDLRNAATVRGHFRVLVVILACSHVLLGPPRTATTWPEIQLLEVDRRLLAFVLERVVSPRPLPFQLLMVTESVRYTPYRVATRLLAQLRRPVEALPGLYGAAPPWTLRLRHVVTLARVLLPLLRSPRHACKQMRLDRWAHHLR